MFLKLLQLNLNNCECTHIDADAILAAVCTENMHRYNTLQMPYSAAASIIYGKSTSYGAQLGLLPVWCLPVCCAAWLSTTSKCAAQVLGAGTRPPMVLVSMLFMGGSCRLRLMPCCPSSSHVQPVTQRRMLCGVVVYHKRCFCKS
jgi:hypothetical protein